MYKTNKRYLNQFLDNLAQTNKSEMTIKNYKHDLIHFISWIECSSPVLLSRIKQIHISNYKEFIKNGGEIKSKPNFFIRSWFMLYHRCKIRKFDQYAQRKLAISSQKRKLSTIKNFYEFLKQTYEDNHKEFKINPVKYKLHGIKLKDIDIKHTKLMTPAHWEAILSYKLNRSMRLLFYLLYYGGLRLSEVRKLKKQDFNDQTKTVTIERKGGKIHILKIQNFDLIFQQCLYVAEYLKTNNDYIFVNKSGNPISYRTLYKKTIEIFQLCDLPKDLGPHSFRKACATNLYKKHKDIIMVRDYLNHSDAKVTQTYIEI